MAKMKSPANDIETATANVENKGDILNREIFEQLINEYVALKKQYVRHFRYSAQAKSSNFGK